MNIPNRAFGTFVLPYTAWLLMLIQLPAQTPPSPTDKISPQATVEKAVWSSDGLLVLAIRIHAGSSKDLDLSLPPVIPPGYIPQKYPADDPLHRVDPIFARGPFSLSGSYLLDPATKNKISALPSLPEKPAFGPMEIQTNIHSGDWIQLAVAFPAPPPPPPGADGKPVIQKLLLYIPLEVKPVEVTIPAK